MDVLVAHGAIDRGLRVQAQRVRRLVLDGDPWLRVRMTYAVDEISWYEEHWSVSLRVRAGDRPEVAQRRALRDRFARRDVKEGQIVCEVPSEGVDEVRFTAAVERHVTPWVDDTHRSPRRRAVAKGRIAVLHDRSDWGRWRIMATREGALAGNETSAVAQGDAGSPW